MRSLCSWPADTVPDSAPAAAAKASLRTKQFAAALRNQDRIDALDTARRRNLTEIVALPDSH